MVVENFTDCVISTLYSQMLMSEQYIYFTTSKIKVVTRNKTTIMINIWAVSKENIEFFHKTYLRII